MLASITPLGERGRRSRWATTASWYVTGSAAGGAAVGALAGLVGSLVIAGVALHVRLALLAATLGVGLVWEWMRGGVPGPRRQVNERWLDTYRGWVYGAGFGAQLGAGVTTVVVSAMIGAIAGLLRGAAVLSGARIITPQRLISFHERMRSLERPVRTAALAAQLALAGLAALLVA
jgi:hypothetical protein